MNKRIVVIVSVLFSVSVNAAPTTSACQCKKVSTVTKPSHPVHRRQVRALSHAPVKTTKQDAPRASQAKQVRDNAPAHSADLPVQKNTGMYVGIEGVTRDIELSYTGKAAQQWPQQKNTSANGARLLLGYRLNDNVSVELGYLTGFSLYDAKHNAASVMSYDARTRVAGGDASVIYRATDIVPGVYVRGGVSYMQAETSMLSHNKMQYRTRRPMLVFPDKVDDTRRDGFGLVAGLGYEAAVTEHVALNAAYTRYQGIAGNMHDAVNMLSVGAKYKF